MTQINNTPTMGKFSWKTKTSRRRKDEEPSYDGKLSKLMPQMTDIKSTGIIGTDPVNIKHFGGAKSEEEVKEAAEAEDGEILEHDKAKLSMREEAKESEDEKKELNKETEDETSPLRRSKRNLRSEDEPSESTIGSIPNSPRLTLEDELTKRVKIHATSMHQCHVCGKMYKHKNCLSKHAWEHHESWNMTKKWCQTKHQQVQMLEAAQVLTEMTLLTEVHVRRMAPVKPSSRKGSIASF